MANIGTSARGAIDPRHCRCFTIQKPYFLQFENGMMQLGYHVPTFEDDHGQILSFATRVSEYSQIHIKLMRSGMIEAEIEPPQDYPGAHLNPIHSYSAHPQLDALFRSLQIPFKCKKIIPMTCARPRVIIPLHPVHRNELLKVTSIAAALDLILNNGNLTRKATSTILDEAAKIQRRRLKRRKYLT